MRDSNLHEDDEEVMARAQGHNSNILSSKIPIEYRNNSINIDPEYKKEGDSGFDLRAEGFYLIKPFERALISTGFHINLPRGYELQVRPRSGLALKQGLTVLNSPGTIDFSYVDEIKVIAINLSNKTISIDNGDRIAQAVICPVASEHIVKLHKVDEFKSSKDRGGFGSTGVS
jgi:dUTP pyrophosphatase